MNRNILKQKVPTHLAFTIMLVLSFLVAWYTVRTGEKLLEGSKKSSTFNLEKRIQKEDPQDFLKK